MKVDSGIQRLVAALTSWGLTVESSCAGIGCEHAPNDAHVAIDPYVTARIPPDAGPELFFSEVLLLRRMLAQRGVVFRADRGPLTPGPRTSWPRIYGIYEPATSKTMVILHEIKDSTVTWRDSDPR